MIYQHFHIDKTYNSQFNLEAVVDSHFITTSIISRRFRFLINSKAPTTKAHLLLIVTTFIQSNLRHFTVNFYFGNGCSHHSISGGFSTFIVALSLHINLVRGDRRQEANFDGQNNFFRLYMFFF